MNLTDTGIEKGLIRFDEDRNFITYVHQNKKRNYNNPEEKVQAETFLTLVLIYGYPENRITYWFNTNIFLEITKRVCSVANIFYLINDNLKLLPIPVHPIDKKKKKRNTLQAFGNKPNNSKTKQANF